MASILVTGGAGYVGSVCANQLLKSGHVVQVVDDLSTGHRDGVPAGAEFHQCHVGDRTAMTSLLRAQKFDALFHFAAKSIVSESVADPELYERENVGAGSALLEVLVENGISNFVFSSTASVYGNPVDIPIDEDDPTEPVNPYGETKLKFERILEKYAVEKKWSVVSFRYFNAAGAADGFGERHHPESHLIPILIECALGQRESVSIFGSDYPTHDGTCMRDYIHVSDIADAHMLAARHFGEAGCYTYNIGTGKSYSVREVVRAVEEVTGKKLDVCVEPRRAGDPAELCANPRKLMAELGWQPRASELKSIIESAYEFKKRG